jgi:hypothetical protein
LDIGVGLTRGVGLPLPLEITASASLGLLFLVIEERGKMGALAVIGLEFGVLTGICVAMGGITLFGEEYAIS